MLLMPHPRLLQRSRVRAIARPATTGDLLVVLNFPGRLLQSFPAPTSPNKASTPKNNKNNNNSSNSSNNSSNRGQRWIGG